MTWFTAFRLLKKAWNARHQSPRRRPVTCRPCLEALETRIVPASNVSYNDFVGPVALDPSNNLYATGAVADTADLRGTGITSQWLQGPARFVAEYNSAGALTWEK